MVLCTIDVRVLMKVESRSFYFRQEATMKHAILMACGLMAACSDDEQAPAIDAATAEIDAAVEAEPDAAAAGRIAATVTYEGSAEGTLLVAAFTSFPPAGAPTGFAQEATPLFPETLAVEALPPGDIYVLALLDVPPASPTQPGPEDLTAWSEALTLVAGETTEVSLTLTDPR